MYYQMPNNNRYSSLKDYATDQPETIQEENLIEHQTDNAARKGFENQPPR